MARLHVTGASAFAQPARSQVRSARDTFSPQAAIVALARAAALTECWPPERPFVGRYHPAGDAIRAAMPSNRSDSPFNERIPTTNSSEKIDHNEIA
jgi:hypothetical protein